VVAVQDLDKVVHPPSPFLLMFPVTLDGMIAVYLVGILCALFFAWLAAEVFRKGRENRRRKHFVICGICDHVFEDPSSHDLAECPRCGAMNERERIIEI
jgi:uncharacterized paraquat-inducible protein A